MVLLLVVSSRGEQIKQCHVEQVIRTEGGAFILRLWGRLPSSATINPHTIAKGLRSARQQCTTSIKMATSLASAAASICPRAVVSTHRRRGAAKATASRARGAPVTVRASGAAYDEVFDGQTGQMVKVLSQSVETVSAGGLDWSYRKGVPEEGVEVKPNKIVLVHGAGLVGFTYSKLMKEMQEGGFECYAPDMPGHGATSKPAPGNGFKYDAASYSAALEAFITELGLSTADEPVDLVVSGFYTSQVRRERSTGMQSTLLSSSSSLSN